MNATSVSARDAVLDLVGKMPKDATFEDIQAALYARQLIEIGIEQVQRGELIDHEEVKRGLSRWLS